MPSINTSLTVACIADTSAWNTVLTGRKLWIMWPPDTPSSVATASDVMGADSDDEAVNHFLELLQRQRDKHQAEYRPVICVQLPGETIFVPSR